MKRLRHFLLAASLVPVAAWAAASFDAELGQRLFRRAWVPAPASTGADDGLGPFFNARSCAACHDGLKRSSIHAADPLAAGFVVRLGDAAGQGDPLLGRQVQVQAIQGLAPEAGVVIGWQDAPGGLRRPDIAVTPASAGTATTTRISLRAAPALGDVGDIEAVSEADILAAEARGMAGGRAARLADGRIGRFGWKATAADLKDFTANAFAADLGMSTLRHPDNFGDCTEAQPECRTAPDGRSSDRVEIAPEIVGFIAAYLREASPPAPVAPPAVFSATGCAACHTASIGSGDRVAHLYSDLLLHDLGPGLDDGVADGAARSSEWRTAPLTGLGRAQGAGLLHDGRARSVTEAILWHGGQASSARDLFLKMSNEERKHLLDFLGSL